MAEELERTEEQPILGSEPHAQTEPKTAADAQEHIETELLPPDGENAPEAIAEKPTEQAEGQSAPSDSTEGVPEEAATTDAELEQTAAREPVASGRPVLHRPQLDEGTTTPMPAATAPLPHVVDAPEPDDPSPEEVPADAPRLSDVGATFASWVRGRADALGALLASHRLAAALAALACVGAILGIVLWGIDAARVPTDEQVADDARARLAAPSYTVGDYAIDDPLVLTNVEVGTKRASSSRRDACDVTVLATFENGGMETRADAQLTYVREGSDWNCTAATVGKPSHRATAGVSQQKVLDNVSALLQAADHGEDGESLAALYRNARVEVVSDNFDEERQTDSLILHCASTGTFVNYECDLTVHFRFAAASGAWELVEALVSDGADDLGFAPLVGTWQGTFVSQQATEGKCLAARETGLTVVVSDAHATDDGDAVIEGTVSGVAHLHTDLASDATQTEGDLVLDAVPFTGSLSAGDVEQDIIGLLAGNDPKRDVAGIVFDCTTQDVAGGNVTLTLQFGLADAPDAATATLTSTHAYEDTILLVLPYQREARFVDSFTLAKAE